MSYPQTSFRSTQFEHDAFVARKRRVVYANTLLYQLQVLKDTGRYDAFKLKWHSIYDKQPSIWPTPDHLFWDSDVAKWIEGACYFLEESSNDTVDAAVKDLVEMIRSAQQPDGYLNIHFTVVKPKERFTNLRDLHELYNCGHLIEAALAHNHFYKNNLLLDPIIRYVDLLYSVFGPKPDQKHGYPGHPEIELALLRLYERTKNPKHLALARYFLDERGNPTGANGRYYYDVEAEARGENFGYRPNSYPTQSAYWYHQAQKPIIEQDEIEGHAVRAMYLLTAVADLVRVDPACNSAGYTAALRRLWNNMVEKKMYLTGGIGAIKQWEGFGPNYFLPQETDEGGCYCETCASIGVMMLAERLLQLNLDRKYSDIMELCFFNAVLTGMSTDGKSFTYENQLASSDTDPCQRSSWFTVSCCPPNVTRLLGYLGGYIWSYEADEATKSANINVHLFQSATVKISVGQYQVELTQKSNYPWDGEVNFSLKSPTEIATTIKLRIPSWASSNWEVFPRPANTSLEKGYLTLTPDYLKRNLEFRLSIQIKARFVSPHPYTNQNVVALARGPLIYCVEDVDNPWVKDHFKSILFDTDSSITESRELDESTKESYVALTAHDAVYLLDLKTSPAPSLPSDSIVQRKQDIEALRFVPFYYRANRGGRGQMRVGLRRKA